MNCRFCNLDNSCDHLLTIENQPPSAQGFFDNQGESYITIDLEIYECNQCGLVQHNSEPVSYYKDVIRAVAYSPEMKIFRLQQFKNFLNFNQLWDKNILEIGSGKGEYLDLFNEAGATRLYGLENSLQSFKILDDKKYNSRRGFLDDKFINNWELSFDAIVSFNFVEHWPDLQTGLKNIKNLLSDDGIGLIEVPNFDHMLRNKIYTEFTADHIFYFTEKTFRNALQSVGFEIISMGSVWKDYILSATVKKRQKINIREMIESKKKNTFELVNFLSTYDGSVVVWGAGHQALSIMAMIRADSFIEYVVDSAPFKQGKFCPVTGLEIFSPMQLKVDCPKCIVVMGAAYSDEIVRIIQNDFGNILDIFIMDDKGIREANG
jgi:SAM-dependent methyltransferase